MESSIFNHRKRGTGSLPESMQLQSRYIFLKNLPLRSHHSFFYTSDTHRHRFATAMMLLEEQSVRKIRDMRQGGDQSLIICFAKRATCDCLNERYNKSKEMPKQGMCDGCEKIIERRKMQLCACKVDQYCSAKCQRESWAKHKQCCEAIRNGEVKVAGKMVY